MTYTLLKINKILNAHIYIFALGIFEKIMYVYIIYRGCLSCSIYIFDEEKSQIKRCVRVGQMCVSNNILLNNKIIYNYFLNLDSKRMLLIKYIANKNSHKISHILLDLQYIFKILKFSRS